MTESTLTPEWGHHFAGLVDGEGCFQILIRRLDHGQRSCRFTIGLRADDTPLLTELRERCGGIGSFCRQERTNIVGGNPYFIWSIQSKPDCAALIKILDRYPLRSKKLRDYKIWKQGVAAWWRRDHIEMQRLSQVLREGRQFNETAFEIPDPDWTQLELDAALPSAHQRTIRP